VGASLSLSFSKSKCPKGTYGKVNPLFSFLPIKHRIVQVSHSSKNLERLVVNASNEIASVVQLFNKKMMIGAESMF